MDGTIIRTAKEEMLDSISELYTKQPNGLISFSHNHYIKSYLKNQVNPPNKKVLVLIVGGHSTGKSSFINWFFGDEIQKTAVAIETSTITFVTTGKRQDIFDGPATIKLFPFLQEYSKEPHFIENLSTQVRIPIEDRSTLVTLIDTPGLIPDVDRLPFDCKNILLKLAAHASLIFVFTDPMGHVFSKTVQEFVKEADPLYHSKMHYFLTMADKFKLSDGSDQVLTSITQDLSKCIKKKDKNLNIYPIYIPEKVPSSRNDLIGNHINKTCEIIKDSVAMTVQTGVSQLNYDIQNLERISSKIIKKMKFRKLFFNISTTFFVLYISFLYCVFKFGNTFGIGSMLYPILFIILIFWLISFCLKPNDKYVNEILQFMKITVPKTKSQLSEFQLELVNVI